MNLEVITMPAAIARLPQRDLGAHTAVVIDVLRATTTAITALAHGAQAVRPVAHRDQAYAERERLATELGPDAVLLGGERQGVPLPGFDLGNSPGDYTAERVAGRRIVQTTSNGTPALTACSGCREVLAGAFVNLGAVVDHLRHVETPVLLVCAGTGPHFALEDGLFASAVVERLQPDHPFAALWRSCAHEPLADLLARSRNGRNLKRLGLAADIAWASTTDRFPVLPHLDRDGWLRLDP